MQWGWGQGRNTPDDWDDRQLLAAVARGGRQADRAMHVLFLRYRARLRQLFWAAGLPRHLEEDLAQEVWAAVQRKAPTYDGRRAEPWFWIAGFARLEIAEAWRRLQQAGQRQAPLPEAEDADAHWQAVLAGLSPVTPEQAHSKRQLLDCVRGAFAGFRQEHAEMAWLVLMRHVEDWSLEQVAQVRGSSVHAASEFLSQARRLFRPHVQPCLELQD